MAGMVKLQGIRGQQHGIAVKAVKVGDVIIWNFGYKSEIVEIMPSKTGKTITLMLKSENDGKIRPRKMGANTLVVVENQKTKEPTNEVEKAIKYRKNTYHGTYADVGEVLDQFSTEELTRYFIDVLKCENSLRCYLENQIIAAEINKLKAV